MSEQEYIKAAHAYFDSWTGGNLRKVDRYEADGFTAEVAGAAGPMNRGRNGMYLENFLRAFAGWKFEG